MDTLLLAPRPACKARATSNTRRCIGVVAAPRRCPTSPASRRLASARPALAPKCPYYFLTDPEGCVGSHHTRVEGKRSGSCKGGSMRRVLGKCLLWAASTGVIFAQAPVGVISGTVTDESDAPIPGASIVIKNKTTGAERSLRSAEGGTYSVPGLPPGLYEVRVEVKGFRAVVREATVKTGSTTAADIRMLVGQMSEVVQVEVATSWIEYDRH